MSFNSLAFLIFLPIVIGIYWLIPARFRKYWLLTSSYFFYMYWNPAFILLLLFSTTVDYFCSRGMEATDKTYVRKALLFVSLCMNLGMLFFFKYWNFFSENVNNLAQALSLTYRVPELSIILPVGISFYTFQTMSYTIDVYRGDYKAEHDFITFALYVTYFPQLVAGPIESPANLLPQLKAEHHFSSVDFSAGVRLLLSGFFRKCVAADFFGIAVNAVFNNLDTANALAVFLGGVLFCFQMYCDFAGYSEIAAGSARLMGVRLMKNFDRPYLSQSYTEFFRRWHISLNRWFTQYVYIPLGGSRRGIAVKIRNTVIVFALCGLWHGARWTYVLWGLYAAFWLCLESALDIRHRFGKKWDTPLGRLVRRSVTFLIFIPAALLFRAESMNQVTQICRILIHDFSLSPFSVSQAFDTLGISALQGLRLCLTITAMYKISAWGIYDMPPAPDRTLSARKLVTAVYLVVLIGLSWVSLLATTDSAAFAYFQF